MHIIKRFAIFAILGPPLAAATLLLMFLPLASWFEGTNIGMGISRHQGLIVYLICLFPAVLIGLFDWVAEAIDVPYRPIATAVVAWVLAVVVLRGVLAMSDIPGWFIAIGALGAIPALVCSWLTLVVNGKSEVKEPAVSEDVIPDKGV